MAVIKKKSPRSSANLRVLSQSPEEVVQRIFSGKLVGGTVSQMATYSDLFLRMPEPVFLLSTEDWTILEANPAALETLQREQSEVLGRPLTDWTHAEDRARAQTFLALPLPAPASDDTPARLIGEFRFLAASGKELMLEIQPCPVQLADYGRAVQVIARDVTQAHRYRKKLEEMNALLQRLSSTDEMTGLCNFRSFKERLSSLHAQAEEEGQGYSILFIDVDHFKKYNDRNGHPAGDEVLRRVARILQSSARPGDLPARYGGEEFVILCPKTSPLQAISLAEQVRAAFTAEVFPHGEHQPLGKVSASIGVAAYPDHGSQPKDVLESADQALYRSKTDGRDRATLALSDALLKKAA